MQRSFILVLAVTMIISSCKKDDPKPLGAQVNAKFLAGEKGKSKSWKLREFVVQIGTNAAQTQTLDGCFADNIYTFSNNDAQDYVATDGTSKCFNSSTDTIESGNWAFTLDGLVINISVDETQTPNGLFSSEVYIFVDDQDNIQDIITGGYTPYPAFVSKLDDNNMVLEINRTRGSSKAKYTLTFTPA